MQGTKVLLENPIGFEFVTKGLVFRAPGLKTFRRLQMMRNM